MAVKRESVEVSTALSVIATCLAANIAIGFVVRKIGCPVYLDTIGTVLATLLLGWRWGLVAALCSVVLGSILIWPQYFWYTSTAIGIVASVELAFRFNFFKSPLRTVWAGIFVAIVAAFLSAPVTAYFQAATFSGNDLITAYFRSMGNSLIESVIFSGLSSEPVDKIITCLIVFYAMKGLPVHILGRYRLRGIL